MNRNFKRTASVIGVVAASSVALAACSGSSNELVGEGASSQQNAMDVFGQVFSENVEGASLAYTASGSGSGRTNFIAGQTDFAGSDSPLADDQVQPAAERCGGNDAWHLPFVIGPVAIAYNLEGVDDLALNVEQIASIFSGEVTNWNEVDPSLPDQNITVIVRSDESGTTGNFQHFLQAATNGAWTGEGEVFEVPANGESANGSSGVAGQVASIPGAITYVEAGFAEQNNLGVADIDFGAGPTELSPETVGAALDALEFVGSGEHDLKVDTDKLFQQNGEGAYPLVLTTYEIVCSAGYDEETAQLLKDFLTVSLNNQDAIAEVGYIPIDADSTHGQRLQSAIDAINA